MKEKINRLARGIVDKETPEIRLIPECFNDVVTEHIKKKFSLTIETSNGSSIKGLCYSENPLVSLSVSSFSGRSSHIELLVNAENKKSGDRITGKLSFITDAGEKCLDYDFQVCAGSSFEALNEERNDIVFSEEVESLKPYIEEDRNKLDNGLEKGSFLAFMAEHFPEDDELLEELCILLIQDNDYSNFAFLAYEEAVNRSLKLTRLYESYMHSLRGEPDGPLPMQILLYFSYENNLTPYERDLLYENILLYQDVTSDIYRVYEQQISEYAVISLFEKRMNKRLAVIYDKMIDRKSAAILPDILKSCLIATDEVRARELIISYPELDTEESYRIFGGEACVPVYFSNVLIYFKDKYGNKLLNVKYTKSELMNRPSLIRASFELYPMHPMLRLSAVKEILRTGITDEGREKILKDAVRYMPLSLSFRQEVIKLLALNTDSSEWLIDVNTDELSNEVRASVFKLYVKTGQYIEAYRMLRKYGMEIGNMESCEELVSKMSELDLLPISQNGPEAFLIALLKKMFDEATENKAVLNLLSAYYEGDTEEMFSLLEYCAERNTDISILAEKVLLAKLFAGTRQHIDEAFLLYAQNCIQKEALVKAYLSLRSYDYFVSEEEVSDILFDALYSYISSQDQLDKLPELYIFALTKHFSQKTELNDDETKLCQKLTDLLIENGFVFYYTKKLKNKIRIPGEICNRYYIEYHGSRENAPRLVFKISSDDKYREVSMNRIYQGIYVKDIVLFVDEKLHYMIYDDSISEKPVQEGAISVKKVHESDDGRYARLNLMSKKLRDGDRYGIKNDILGYVLEDGINRELFKVEG
ncbi:MAG: DUF5717 family protein [Eubacteriales bacterium]|nr:DUF5717 family protein [Eubacteriales bacterium]